MSEEGLHIDTVGVSTAFEHEQDSEGVKQDSLATTSTDPESPSGETDDSPVFDDSDKIIHDISPTTPIHPEHHEHAFEKTNDTLSFPEPVEPDTSTEKSSPDQSLLEETDKEAEQLNEEAGQEKSEPDWTDAERSSEEPVQDPSSSEPTKKDEAQYPTLSTSVEPESHIKDTPSHHTTSTTAESEISEEGNIEGKSQETPESSIAGAEGTAKEDVPEPSHSDKIEQETTLEEIQEPAGAGEKEIGELAGKELQEASLTASIEPEITTDMAAHGSEAPTGLKELTINQPSETSKEISKLASSDREKRALDIVKRSRIQFRVAMDVFLQLINENEDDEGIIRLNLVGRDSDLRKTVRMLGLKLQSLDEAERDLDWAQLLDRFEAKKEQE